MKGLVVNLSIFSCFNSRKAAIFDALFSIGIAFDSIPNPCFVFFKKDRKIESNVIEKSLSVESRKVSLQAIRSYIRTSTLHWAIISVGVAYNIDLIAYKR